MKDYRKKERQFMIFYFSNEKTIRRFIRYTRSEDISSSFIFDKKDTLIFV